MLLLFGAVFHRFFASGYTGHDSLNFGSPSNNPDFSDSGYTRLPRVYFIGSQTRNHCRCRFSVRVKVFHSFSGAFFLAPLRSMHRHQTTDWHPAVHVFSYFGCYIFFWCSFSLCPAQTFSHWPVFWSARIFSVRMIASFLVLFFSRPASHAQTFSRWLVFCRAVTLLIRMVPALGVFFWCPYLILLQTRKNSACQWLSTQCSFSCVLRSLAPVYLLPSIISWTASKRFTPFFFFFRLRPIYVVWAVVYSLIC